MKLPSFLRLTAALTAMLLLGTVPVRAAIPAAEQLLPSDTLAVVSIPDYQALHTASQHSPQMMCWNSAEMTPFRQKLTAKITEALVGPVEKQLGVKLADFGALLQGQLTVAVTLNQWNGDPETAPGIILLLDARDQSALLQTNLDTLRQKLQTAARPPRKETLHGIEFSVVTLTTNGVPSSLANLIHQPQTIQEAGKPDVTPSAGEIVFGQYQSLLIVANSLSAAEPIAAHLTGGGAAPLAENSLFAEDQAAQLRDAPVYYGWVNGKQFVSTLASHPPTPPNPEAPSPLPQIDPRGVIQAMGLNGLKSLTFAVRETTAGESASVYFRAPASERTGLLKMLTYNAKSADIPDFVPADAVKFYRVRLDGHQMWVELNKVAANISPTFLSSLNSGVDMANTLAQAKTPGFDLRTALFANLGDDMIGYQKAPTGDSASALSSPPGIFLLGVVNPEQVIGAVQTLVSLACPQVGVPAPRDFVGHKIYTLNWRAGFDSSGQPLTKPFYLSSANGYLAFSSNPGMIEEFLRGGGTTHLRATDGLDDAAAAVGGTGGGLFSYTNQRETMRTLFKLFKIMGSTPGPIAGPLPMDWRVWADVSLLPDYDAVAKYFGLTVLGGTVNSEGVSIRMFSPRPAGL